MKNDAEREGTDRVNIYINRTFTGHYPVGTSAVVVAPNNVVAAEMLEEELKNHGLSQKIDPKEMERLSTYRLSVVILNNGNYRS